MSTPKGCIKRGEMLFADPASIVRKQGWNPRFDFGDLSEIEGPMKDHGFYKHKPLLVRRNDAGDFEIIDGDRRFTVVQKLLKAGHKFEEGIPIVLADKLMDDAEALIETITSNNGKNLLPLEEAAAYKRLLDMDVTPKLKLKDVAKRVGKSEGHVKWTLELLTADDSVKDAVTTGAISGTLAKTIATKAKGNAAKQKELVAQAKSGKGGKKLAKREAEAIQKKAGTKRRAVIKSLSMDELKALIEKNQDDLLANLESVGLKDVDDVRKYAQESDERALCFLYGVFIGVSAAMGKRVKVTL